MKKGWHRSCFHLMILVMNYSLECQKRRVDERWRFAEIIRVCRLFEYADGVLGSTSSGWECSECGSLHWLDDSVWRLVGRRRGVPGWRTLIGLSYLVCAMWELRSGSTERVLCEFLRVAGSGNWCVSWVRLALWEAEKVSIQHPICDVFP